jgi:hypothetical protein
MFDAHAVFFLRSGIVLVPLAATPRAICPHADPQAFSNIAAACHRGEGGGTSC